MKENKSTTDLKYLYVDLGNQQQKIRNPLIINETKDSEEIQNSIVLYPNPVTQVLEIIYEGTEQEAYLGEKIDLNARNQINTTNYPNGVYIINIGNASAKFVVQH